MTTAHAPAPDDATAADLVASRRSGYELVVGAVSVLAVILLLVDFFVPLQPETHQLILWVDWALCAFFFYDFVRSLIEAPNRWYYLRTTGWIDLLSSVPVIESLRFARVARIVRVIRAIRVLVISHTLGRRLRENPRENALLSAGFICLSMVAVASVAVLEVERGVGNIRNAGDALWWAVTTITTVGYGDHAPVTALGRAIGVVLMLIGVGAFGLLAGLLASVLVEAPEAAESASTVNGRTLDVDAVQTLTALRDEVAALRDEVAALRAEHAVGVDKR